MTNNSLRLRFIFVLAAIASVLTVSFIEQYWSGKSESFISKNATLIALLIAAYLAFVFQQRGKFVDDLRRWWNEIVTAKSTFFIYCEKSNPSEQDYFDAFYKLSTSMDTLRLIYCNVGRSKNNQKGLYPFEQVRDIIDIAKSVRPSISPTSEDRLKAKLAIDLVFQSLRHAIQGEAKASTPDEPTLFESEYRRQYIAEIKKGSGVDIDQIRSQNHKLDYVSRRENMSL